MSGKRQLDGSADSSDGRGRSRSRREGIGTKGRRREHASSRREGADRRRSDLAVQGRRDSDHCDDKDGRNANPRRRNDSSRAAAGGPDSSPESVPKNHRPPPPPRERLPKEFLPDRGRVKARPAMTAPLLFGRISLLKYGPYENGGKQEWVGNAHYKDVAWRTYDHVEFMDDGTHFLRIRLTAKEMSSSAALRRDGSRAKYGWALFELSAAKIPDGKDYYQSQFYIYRKPTVLMSLFDGIGGGRVAMESLEERYVIVRSFSSETDATAKAVVKKNYPDTLDLGGVDQIDRRTVKRRILGDGAVQKIRRCATWDDEIHFVVIAGPPCQNLSQAKAVDGVTEGVLDGDKSRLFFHVPHILKYLTDALFNDIFGGDASKEDLFHAKKIVHALVENVEMSNRDRSIFSTFLGGVNPWKIDMNEGGCCASLMSRRRLYWCSHMPEGGEVGFEHFRRAGCGHPARMEGGRLEDVLAQHGKEGYEYCNNKTGRTVERLPTMTRFIQNKGQENYHIRRCSRGRRNEERNNGDEQMIPAPEDINEDLLGFPVQYTKFGVGGSLLSEEDRRLLLGNTFMVFHIRYMLLMMHRHTDLVQYVDKDVAYVPMLPQNLCQQKIDSGIGNTNKYRNISSVLQKLERDRQGAISQFFRYN